MSETNFCAANAKRRFLSARVGASSTESDSEIRTDEDLGSRSLRAEDSSPLLRLESGELCVSYAPGHISL
jgi:hypothetical protein